MANDTASVPGPANAPPEDGGESSRRLIRKLELEAAMAAAPENADLRSTYFGLLREIASTCTGLAWAVLPELGFPLAFRCGTADATSLIQAFREGSCDFPLRAAPQRILVLGAYAGYSAVALARRFPRAQLLCIEPLNDNFRLLSLNTSPYRRIRLLQAAAWHSAARLAVISRQWGDWGARLFAEGTPADRTIPALPVAEILRAGGWDQADLIVADIVGSELDAFADPLAPWLDRLDAAVVHIYEDLAKGSRQTVTACFDPEAFEVAELGTRLAFQRRAPLRLLPPAPPEIRLVSAEPRWQPLGLQNVAQAPWAFFFFEGEGCQLHPNAPGQPPARLILPCRLAGHTSFTAGLWHAGRGAAPVTFSVFIETAAGTVVASGSRTLAMQEQARFSLPLPTLSGDYRVVLQTEMAGPPGAAANANAWARWLGPKLA